MNINNLQEHTGAIIKKNRDIFHRHLFTIDTGIQNISVVVGKGLFDLYNIGDIITVGHIGKKLVNIRPAEYRME